MCLVIDYYPDSRNVTRLCHTPRLDFIKGNYILEAVHVQQTTSVDHQEDLENIPAGQIKAYQYSKQHSNWILSKSN